MLKSSLINVSSKNLWVNNNIDLNNNNNNNNNNNVYEGLCLNRSEAEYLRSAVAGSTLVVCLLGHTEGPQRVMVCSVVVVLRHELVVQRPVMCPSSIHQMVLVNE